ncbi:PREDICTED: uncharacterized protein LOC109231682 [Nicotiana attenuata]|uniref:uncharacterized protein LOC109231682 n=1 Tax=Nicotiana attenuata TaxID=49451 RepID=UPI000904EA42|nr:PREDICTED: uncharacterized protein LOC109231682 [Nicotiana attenuata]
MDYDMSGINIDDETIAHFALLADSDPITFESVVQEAKWKEAMDVEISAIEKNDTWELTDLPKGQKSKHIDVEFHILRDLTKEKIIDVVYCRSEDQVGDILTKPLNYAAFVKLRKLLEVYTLREAAVGEEK